jgi:putative ABC transport system permease protein
MELCRLGIAGVFENYYGQLFFLTPRSCEQAFGAAPEPNCFFVKIGGMSLDRLRQALKEVRGVTKVSDANADRNVIGQFTAALNFVVWLSLFLAAMMACFIVANFTVTYVQRKTRELTIMRINGFSTRACVVYCAVDLAVTTALGTLLGLVFGNSLGQAILRTTETPYIQMIREPAVQSFLFSALITCGFSVLINLFALRRIKDLKLADINS